MGNASSQRAPKAKTERLTIRLLVEEHSRIVKVAGWRGSTASAFIREAVMNAVKVSENHPRGGVVSVDQEPGSQTRRWSDEELAELHATRIEAKRIGVNLNQFRRDSQRGVLDLGGLADVVAELAVKYDELVELYGGRTRA